MRADRLVAVLLLLQARGGMSAPALADELELTFDSLVDARVQLLGLGAAVVVEEPATLRSEMSSAAAAVVDLYAKP